METDPACHECAARPGADTFAWSMDRTDGETRRLCPDCARVHCRDIEARLPREWWS